MVTKIVDGDDGGMKILFGNCSEIASKSIPEQFPNKAKKILWASHNTHPLLYHTRSQLLIKHFHTEAIASSRNTAF